jgi:hypothetical protein
MYKFIKILFHIDPVISHVAYLYQDITTHKYYLSHTPFNSEDIIDNSNQYILIDNKPKITIPSFIKNIDIVTEVTLYDFALKKINNYKL